MPPPPPSFLLTGIPTHGYCTNCPQLAQSRRYSQRRCLLLSRTPLTFLGAHETGSGAWSFSPLGFRCHRPGVWLRKDPKYSDPAEQGEVLMGLALGRQEADGETKGMQGGMSEGNVRTESKVILGCE